MKSFIAAVLLSVATVGFCLSTPERSEARPWLGRGYFGRRYPAYYRGGLGYYNRGYYNSNYYPRYYGGYGYPYSSYYYGGYSYPYSSYYLAPGYRSYYYSYPAYAGYYVY